MSLEGKMIHGFRSNLPVAEAYVTELGKQDGFRRLRQALGLSLDQVAAAMNPAVSRQAIHRLEKDGRPGSLAIPVLRFYRDEARRRILELEDFLKGSEVVIHLPTRKS